MTLKTFLTILPILLLTTIANAQSISVNFHVSDDLEGQDNHIFDGIETAGVSGSRTAAWNNIPVGNGGGNAGTEIFAPANLDDDSGNAAAMLSSTLVGEEIDSTWFIGYAASAATEEAELGNDITDDNLFNSYLALNGPSGDGSPADSFVLEVTGLGTDYTDNGYSLIIYSDSDRRDSTANNSRLSNFAVTADGVTSNAFVEDDDPGEVVNVFDGTYLLSDGVEDGADYSNYTMISDLTASSFTLEVTSPDGGRGAISGFQIVANSTFLLGDVDRNGTVNFSDIAPFISLLAMNGFQREADINDDEILDFQDISPFITLLIGSGS